MDGQPSFVMEVKTKETKLVGLNDATEVLAASELHSHKDKPCVTVCNPGVDPEVPALISKCGRLCVVESAELMDVLIRAHKKRVSISQLFDWLITPGQATASKLYLPSN